MKRVVVTFGILSGVLSSLMMCVSLVFMDSIGFDYGLIYGYTAIVLSFLFVFFGIRSYRDNVGGGSIAFGRAFLVGILITLISCGFYVMTWEILYFNFLPDFMDKWAAYAIEQAKASGASEAAIQARDEEMHRIKELLQNPFYNAALTFVEPFPVGLAITLLSAAILRKKPAGAVAQTQAAL